MYVCHISDNMYDNDITLCFNGTKKEMDAYFRRRFDLYDQMPKREGEFSRVTSSDGSIAYVIYLERFSWKIIEYGLLAHEVMHLVHRAMDDLGFYLADASSEAYAYYFQRIYQECIYGIKEKLKKEKK